jgi:hypothetical protein
MTSYHKADFEKHRRHWWNNHPIIVKLRASGRGREETSPEIEELRAAGKDQDALDILEAAILLMEMEKSWVSRYWLPGDIIGRRRRASSGTPWLK